MHPAADLEATSSQVEDYADQPPTAARMAAEIAMGSFDAGSLPQGIPPGHEFQRRRYDQGAPATSKNTFGDELTQKPRGTGTSLQLGASLRVTGQVLSSWPHASV
jgi:hypothetical protein